MSFSRSALAAAACLALGLSFVSTAVAQSDASTQQMVLTATRQPTRIDAQLSDVTVLDRTAIEHAGGLTLAELLGRQPGLQTYSNGGPGQTSGLSIRGTEARHTLLIIDGVRYGSATLGLPVYDNIPLEDIDHIEIVRGPLSSLYGADAAGGVVQIFTRRGTQGFHPDASVGVGSHRALQAGAGASFGDGRFSGSLHLQHQQTRGFSATNEKQVDSFNPDDDGFRQNAASASVGWRIDDDWQWHAQALRAEGVVHYDDGPLVDTRARMTSETLTTDVAGRVSPGWRTVVRAARSTDVYDTLESTWGSGLYRTVQDQLSWDNTVDTPVGSLLALVERLTQKVHKSDVEYPVTDRAIDAVALGLNGHAGPHTWQLSARHDRNSQFGTQNTGNAAYGFDLTPAWRIGAALGTSFAAPSFNLLYWPGFGNPDLLPERGRSREANLRWRPSDTQRLTLTAFSQHIRNYITATNQNVSSGLIDGATLAYEGRFDAWTLSSSIDELNARDDSGKRLPRRAKHAFHASADRSFGAWSAGGDLSAYSSRTDTVYDSNFQQVTVGLPRYVRLDLGSDWQLAPDWTLQARLNNVTDKRYETAYGYNQPGREWLLTLRWAPR